jgi:integrase
MKRNRNDHIRKLCEHAKRQWPTCPCPWHFNFSFKGTAYRFSLERELPNRRITTKLEAEAARDEITAAIRAGTFQRRGKAEMSGGAVRATLTVRQLFDRYEEGHVMKKRPESAKRWRLPVAAICRRMLTLPTGTARAFGDWVVVDVTIDAIEQFQELRRPHGVYAMNRDLELLRAVFNWGTGRGLIDGTPFKRGGVNTITRATERRRSRRLEPGEAERLLAACPRPADPSRDTHPIRALIEAALETGCRRGELLTLQWSQVRLDGPRPALVLTAAKTKTKTLREVPISTRLRAILEMRRDGADGQPHAPTAFVFGTSTGEAIGSFKRAWQSVRLRAHGFTPVQVKGTGRLTPENLAQLATIDLHWHDLRREAGSRWLDAGLPLHTIQRWLGHTNISQTSTYLAVTDTGSHEAMARFDAARGRASQPDESDDVSTRDLQIANGCAKESHQTRQDAMLAEKAPHEIRESVN